MENLIGKVEMGHILRLTLLWIYFCAPLHATLYVLQMGRCLRNGSQYLAARKLFNELQCAALCDNYTSCSSFMTVTSNSTCQLFTGIDTSLYYNLSYSSNACRIGISSEYVSITQHYGVRLTFEY